MTPLPQAFFRSYVLDKTSDNLLSYLLLDSRVGAVVHSEQYFFFFYPNPGYVSQTKGSRNLGLSLRNGLSYFFSYSVSVSFENVNQGPLLVRYP